MHFIECIVVILPLPLPPPFLIIALIIYIVETHTLNLNPPSKHYPKMMQQFNIAPSFLSCFSAASIDRSAECRLWVDPRTTSWILLSFIFAYSLYAMWVFTEWERAFGGNRLARCKKASPSNKQMPDIMT